MRIPVKTLRTLVEIPRTLVEIPRTLVEILRNLFQTPRTLFFQKARVRGGGSAKSADFLVAFS